MSSSIHMWKKEIQENVEQNGVKGVPTLNLMEEMIKVGNDQFVVPKMCLSKQN